MSDVLTMALAAYMLLGMFALVVIGALEVLTSSWIELLDRGWLPVTRSILYLLAVGQITVFWIVWPFVVWHTLAAERRRGMAP